MAPEVCRLPNRKPFACQAADIEWQAIMSWKTASALLAEGWPAPLLRAYLFPEKSGEIASSTSIFIVGVPLKFSTLPVKHTFRLARYWSGA